MTILLRAAFFVSEAVAPSFAPLFSLARGGGGGFFFFGLGLSLTSGLLTRRSNGWRAL